MAKQAFVGRFLSDLWFQWLSGFPLRNLGVRDFLCDGDHMLLARAGALSFCLGLRFYNRRSVLPEILEPIGSHVGVSYRVHDILVPHVML